MDLQSTYYNPYLLLVITNRIVNPIDYWLMLLRWQHTCGIRQAANVGYLRALQQEVKDSLKLEKERLKCRK